MLKQEIQREHPSLRFAFSRPGFVTFKQLDGTELPADFQLKSVFARAYGLSLLRTDSIDKILQMANELSGKVQKKLRLHVWERDQHAPTSEPKDYVYGDWIPELLAQLKDASCFEQDTQPQLGDWVFDVVVVEKDQWWIGVHQHSKNHSPFVGGRPSITLPENAPSRAYLKLEEALLWSGVTLRKGDTVVEIGSAPGGASHALLERGLRVVGIDPGEMAPIVLNHPHFTHIRKPVADVLREDLPRSVQWLLSDMNLEPRHTLFAVDRLGTRMQDSLLGMILTLKLNKWSMAKEIPYWFEHLKAMGMVSIRATQLVSNRQEICFIVLTRKGNSLYPTSSKQLF